MLFFPSVAGRPGRLTAMSSLDRAQLSAIASSIDDAIVRVAALGEQLDTGGTADAANALFEAERSLTMATRALERAGKALGDA